MYTMVAALDYFYWVFGTWLGGTLGSILAIQIKGLDFAMTALFWSSLSTRSSKKRATLARCRVSGCLTLVGSTYFLLVTLLLLVVEFTILYRRRTMK